MKLQEILEQAVRDEDVSDVFLVAGLPVTMKRSAEGYRFFGGADLYRGTTHESQAGERRR